MWIVTRIAADAHLPRHALPRPEPVPVADDVRADPVGLAPDPIDEPAPVMAGAVREPAGRSASGFRGHAVAFARELLVVVVGALLVSCLVRLFVAQVFDIPSESMDPTLVPGNRVVVVKFGPVERGDVIVFHDPGGWLTPPAPELDPVARLLDTAGIVPASTSDHVVKRVIGMPGDTVSCCDGRGWLIINGHAVHESQLQDPPSAIPFTVVVPAGHVFVLGDNRSRSRDSRCHLRDPGTVAGQNAFIPMDRIVGHGVAVAWPMSHWRGLAAPQVYRELPAGRVPAPAVPIITAGPEASC